MIRRRREISAVENVEKFSAKLRVETFRDASDAIVLEYRDIQFRHSRTNQGIATQISPFVHARKGQTLGLDVMVRISGVSQGVASRPRQAVRKLTDLIQFLTRRITAQYRGKRLARARFVKSPELPATGSPGQGSRISFRAR
jgi:hypothetical protein